MTVIEDDGHYTNLPNQIVRIRMDRVWEMPNPWTFQMKYVKQLLTEQIFHPSVDAFAGHSSICTVTNDINPNLPTIFHEDALTFLERQQDISFMTAISPYSNNQFRECYKEFGQEPNPQVFNAHWQSVVKDNIARISIIVVSLSSTLPIILLISTAFTMFKVAIENYMLSKCSICDKMLKRYLLE